MPPKKLDQLQDWDRALLILRAIIVSNFCFPVFLLAAAFASRGQQLIQQAIFLLPIFFCILYIGVFSKSRLELWIASSLALFRWVRFDLVMLISFFVPFKAISSHQALFLGINVFGTALCALFAHLGQRIRRKVLTPINNSHAI